MRKEYFLKPILVCGLSGGLLAGIPGCCYLCFGIGIGAGILAVLWGKNNGAAWTSLSEPTLVGLAAGGVGLPMAAIAFAVLLGVLGAFIPSIAEMGAKGSKMGTPPPVVEIDPDDPDAGQPDTGSGSAPTGSGQPPSAAQLAGILFLAGLLYGAIAGGIYAGCATLGGLIGGAIWQQKDYVPPAPPPAPTAPIPQG